MNLSPSKQWSALHAALERTMREHAPGWTDHSEHDPGVTIVELIAYLAEDLQRTGVLGEQGGPALSRAIQSLGALARRQIATSGTVRPNFFDGRVLTADDLREEQEYHREKHRRHLQMLHGFGVVDGLDLDVAADGATISIEPGVAIDEYGREIVLDDMVVMPIPPDAVSPCCVVVQYAERMVDPVPVADGDTEPSHIEEGCDVFFEAGPCDGGIAVARLVREAQMWRVDSSFVAARLPSAIRRDR